MDTENVDGLTIFLDDYNNQIESICAQTLSRHKYGLPVDEEYLQKSNESLYKLFQYRNNIIQAIIKKDEDE